MRENDCISINGQSDIDYWAQRFSVSPFTLFQLLKNTGNSAPRIEEYLRGKSRPSDFVGKFAKIKIRKEKVYK